MEKPLAMMLLTVGGFAAAAILLAMLFPSITRTGNAIATEREGLSAQSLEEIAVVNSYSELDGSGTWQDIDSDTYFDVWIWVKNTGAVTIDGLDDLDVFVHHSGTSQRIPHSSDAGAAYPQWHPAVEGGGTWTADSTLKITVHYSAAIGTGDYQLEVATPAGAVALGNFAF